MKKFLLILTIFLLVLAIVVIFRAIPKEKRGLERAEVKIGEQIFVVEIADTPAKRTQGLSGREGLREGEGMLFVFDKPATYDFWMKGMKFPIDIIWIRSDKIIGFEENISPDNSASPKIYSPTELVDKVLEVNAGTVSKLGIQISQSIEVLK